MERKLINCFNLQKKLPALDSPPIPTELGKKIFENISEEAWNNFLEYFKIIVNEYRTDLSSKNTDKFFEDKAEEYLFKNKVVMPKEFIKHT